MFNLKNLFRKRRVYEENNINKSFNPVELVYYNDMLSIVERCCRCCTNSNPAKEYKDKCTYVEKRINDAHDSILEHSNIVMAIPKSLFADIPDILPGLRYMNIIKDQNGIFMAGSLRAYKYLLTHSDRDSALVHNILENLLICTPRSLVVDITNAGIYNLHEYSFAEYIGECNVGIDFTDDTDKTFEPYMNALEVPEEYADTIEIVNFDDVSKSTIDYEKISYTDDTEEILPEISNAGPFDLLKLGTITVCFKNLSRAATHQLVRHRNGITQESQRYINVSKNPMYVPKKDKYNGKEVTVTLNGKKVTTTLEGLNNIFKKPYDELIAQGIDKEDARGYLPANIMCAQLYMTFTWENLMKFFKLRRDKAAQLEIRTAADALYETVRETFNIIFSVYGVDLDYLIEHCDTYYYETALFENYDYSDDDINEVVGEETES